MQTEKRPRQTEVDLAVDEQPLKQKSVKMGACDNRLKKTSFFLMVSLTLAYKSQAEFLNYLSEDKYISSYDTETPTQAIRLVQYIADHKAAVKIVFNAGNLEHIPDDALASNKFAEVEFYHVRMEEVPYRLLNPVCGSLKKLTLYRAHLTKKTLPSGGFQRCEQLQYLRIQNSDLRTINPKAFIGLTALTHLDLSENAFKRLNRGAFLGLSLLNILKLRSSQLELLDEELFDPIQETLVEVDLSDNPLQCDCSLQWLKDRFRDRNSTKPGPGFITLTNNITCRTPVRGNFETVDFCNKTSSSQTTLTSSQAECKTDQPCACLLRKLLEQALTTLQQECTNQKNDEPSNGLAEKSNDPVTET